MTGGDFTRRDFLRLAAGGALLASGVGCSSASDEPKSTGGAPTTAGAKAGRTLRIAQWNNYVAGYDQWWDNEYTKRWGERNGIEVGVDHFDINQLPAHAEAEAASQRGHDLFHFNLASPAPSTRWWPCAGSRLRLGRGRHDQHEVVLPPVFEDSVIDHREIIEEVEARVGKMTPFVERCIFNPRTKKYFGFSDFWAPNPVHYRTDLWDPLGVRPDTWEGVVAGCDGWFSGMTNIIPRACVTLFELAVEKADVAGAREHFERMFPLCDFMCERSHVRVAHTALELLGRPMGLPRRPLRMLEAADRAELERLLRDFGAL